MPLRDHFRPPLKNAASWEGFHGQWPAVIVQYLGKLLPDQFVAEPRVHLGSHIEIDIATFETADFATSATANHSQGGVTAVWAPAQPTLAVETELPDCDEYEVRVYDMSRGRRLVAAVELVSPANKDRSEHRRMFVAKCATLLLQQHVSVLIVDLVTVREHNLYADLLEMLQQKDPDLGTPPPSQYAVECQLRESRSKWMFETWYQPLELGKPLPRHPLWLTDDFSVPLDLEETYEQTCRDLRLPTAV